MSGVIEGDEIMEGMREGEVRMLVRKVGVMDGVDRVGSSGFGVFDVEVDGV